jgi:PAS domain S-box-containing protein
MGSTVCFVKKGAQFNSVDKQIPVVMTHSFFLDLADGLRAVVDPSLVAKIASEKLGNYLNANHVSYAEIDEPGIHAIISQEWNDGSISTKIGSHVLMSFGADFVAELKDGTTIAINDVTTDSRTSSPFALQTFKSQSIRSFINIPLLEDGILIAVLAIHCTRPRSWSDEDIFAAQETAGRTWSALLRARAEKELKDSESRLRNIFQAIDEGYCLCEIILDDNGKAVDYRFVEINALFEKMTGLLNPVGRTALELVPNLEKRWIETYAEVALHKKTLRFEDNAEAMQRIFDVFATPVEPHGYFAIIFKDITEQKRAENRLQQSHDTYLSLIENNPMGVYLIDSAFRLLQFSKGAAKVFSTINQPLGRDFAEILRTIWTEPFATKAIGHFRNTLETGDFFHSRDTTEKRADTGSTESYDWQIERVKLPQGNFGVVCYFYDMTERHRYEEHIRTLMDEVNHRSKNTLTVITAIARHTASNDQTDFLPRFEDRIQALAATQDILVKSAWKSADLMALVMGQLSFVKDLIGNRIHVKGPPTVINSGAAESIALAIHELSTNSMKYGSLSNQQGIVEIHWQAENAGAGKDQFTMTWTESLGPPVASPTRKGFGSTVIVNMARRSVNGEVALSYLPQGVKWTLQCPLENVISVTTT